MNPQGLPGSRKSSQRTLRVSLGLSGALKGSQGLSGLFGNFWSSLGLSGTLWGSQELSEGPQEA